MISFDGKDLTLEQYCRVLNEGGGGNFLFKKIKVVKAQKKVGAIGVKSLTGKFVIEANGYKTEFEFVADDVEAIRSLG